MKLEGGFPPTDDLCSFCAEGKHEYCIWHGITGADPTEFEGLPPCSCECKPVDCSNCDGRGSWWERKWFSDYLVTCTVCWGKGIVYTVV